MAKPYQDEMARLTETLQWAESLDLSALRQALRSALLGPLVAVGSGGSLSAAHALARFHRLASGHVSTVLTPLESTGVRHDFETAVWLLSASGSNVDIVRAAKALAIQEPRQLAALVGRNDSKVGQIARSHPYIDLLAYAPPTGKDGFLATNTLLGAVAILGRAYTEVVNGLAAWDSDGLQTVRDAADAGSSLVKHWREITEPLWDRDTTVILHGADCALGAVDLESKFTEAALGHAQIADFRNFAHGRHHWLAKRANESGVVAFIGGDDTDLADRTLALLPPEIPVARIEVSGSPIHTNLVALIAAFRLTDWVGQARGIDPGDPGVPEFGRRIYHLSPTTSSKSPLPAGLTRRAAAAIERKSGRTVQQLAASSELALWRDSFRIFQRALTTTTIGSVLLDYDGTVVDTRHRFDPPGTDIQKEIVRLLESGIGIGIATGRGRSARLAFREVIPAQLWSRVVVGYYNGAEVSTLDDDATPQIDQTPVPELRDIARELLLQPDLAALTQQDHRRNQLTVTAQGGLHETRIWEIVQTVVRQSSLDVTVVRSSHSIDVLSSTATKLAVVPHLRRLAHEGSILAIGDRGRWPGNDYELLSLPLSLSVDESSSSRDTCWNLGAPGQRGSAITIEYLRALQPDINGHARVVAAALR